MHQPPKFICVIAIASLVANIPLHVATFIPQVHLTFVACIPAFLLTFVAAGTASMLVNHFYSAVPRIRSSDFLKNCLNQYREKLDYGAKIRTAVSWPWRAALVAAVLYVALNAGISFHQSEGGTPKADQFGYVLTQGRTSHPLTLKEYQILQALQMRTTTAVAMLVSLVSIIGTFVVYPKIAEQMLNPPCKSLASKG